MSKWHCDTLNEVNWKLHFMAIKCAIQMVACFIFPYFIFFSYISLSSWWIVIHLRELQEFENQLDEAIGIIYYLSN